MLSSLMSSELGVELGDGLPVGSPLAARHRQRARCSGRSYDSSRGRRMRRRSMPSAAAYSSMMLPLRPSGTVQAGVLGGGGGGAGWGEGGGGGGESGSWWGGGGWVRGRSCGGGLWFSGGDMGPMWGLRRPDADWPAPPASGIGVTDEFETTASPQHHPTKPTQNLKNSNYSPDQKTKQKKKTT